MREAVSLAEQYPEYATDKMTDTAKAGFNSLHNQLQEVELGLDEMAHMFPYADLNGFPHSESAAFDLWHDAMLQLEEYGESKRILNLEACVKKLSDFQMQNDKDMSALQTSLLRRILTITLDLMSNEL